MKQNFLNEDKTQINLPIAFGDKYYETNTRCGDFCLFQEEKFNLLYPKNNKSRCNSSLLCHTVKLETTSNILSWENLEYVLDNWGTKCFKTKEEAEIYINEQIKYRCEILSKFGIKIDNRGYSKGD